MSNLSKVQPTLLGKINERQVLRTLQAQGPLSRAEVARFSGISAPTASKAVESLMKSGYLEEGDADEIARGRPAKKLRLATRSAQVLGVVVDVDRSRVVSAGLDGRIHDDLVSEFNTPETYETLIEEIVSRSKTLMRRPGIATLGIAVSLPGQIDYRQGRSIFSPNVPVTNCHAPGLDISEKLGVECLVIQESHALCLAEKQFGAAKGLDDFAMLDAGAGLGLGVMSGGKLLTGNTGLAGEIGHITVDIDGRKCGCGNYGCLETLACEAALAWQLSQRLDRKIDIERMLELLQEEPKKFQTEIDSTCNYLAIALSAVINLFNPSTLFVHGRFFSTDESIFPTLIEKTKKRTLPPSFQDCRIIQARGSKRQGAIATIIEHITSSVVPELTS